MTIAYIRTYSNKQQTESQKNAIEQFAKAKKIEIDKWLKDAKNSPKGKNRLEDVIKNLQEGDILIVADVTRLSRKLMEIMHLILLCLEKKVTLYCIKEGYSFEDDVDSKTLAFTFGLVSEIESKLISARTKEALTASKNKGTKLGRPLGSPKTEFLLSQKNQIERELKEETGIEVLDTDELEVINPCLFSTPGMTDESNALVKIVLNRDTLTGMSQDGAEGSECFDGFSFLTKEQAQKILKDGVDEYGIFYSVYTWTALTYFVADMWNRNPIYKCIKK